MHDDGILALRAAEVAELLRGRDLEVVDIVRAAYEAHARGATTVPHSLFLNLPSGNRIIALPAYLDAGVEVAGMKWVASFPRNIDHGMERASALIVLNSTRTGRPEAILEGSIVNALRTAASAALAVRALYGDRELPAIGFVGCGVINFEIARLITAVRPDARRFRIFDVDPGRAARFADRCARLLGADVQVAAGREPVLAECPLVSIATTAATPHIHSLSGCQPGALLLHISLRDIDPEQIVRCDNVVDDADHVCRAETSLHLAERRLGTREFIRCTLGDVLTGRAPARATAAGVAVFSPFGLGILDVTVAARVVELARERGAGTIIESFLPPRAAG